VRRRAVVPHADQQLLARDGQHVGNGAVRYVDRDEPHRSGSGSSTTTAHDEQHEYQRGPQNAGRR
jgi:hypothetical protein